MNIMIQVNLVPGDDLAKTAQQIADEFLALIGGNPATDTVGVNVNDSGQAGGTAALAQSPPA